MRAIRQILSDAVNPHIDEVIASGCVPALISLLGLDAKPKIQFEAVWAINNSMCNLFFDHFLNFFLSFFLSFFFFSSSSFVTVASGNSAQTRLIVDAGVIPLFARLVNSPEVDVAETSIWALGNIAGDGAELRDRVLNAGVPSLFLSKILVCFCFIDWGCFFSFLIRTQQQLLISV